ncbi:unnamed protein product [Effrenium voratum]|nr:unnamed protein product [Effrenium voratum]
MAQPNVVVSVQAPGQAVPVAMPQQAMQPPAQAYVPPSAPRQVMMSGGGLPNTVNFPVQTFCPNCQTENMTNVSHQMGAGGWVWCLGFTCLTSGVLFCVGFLPCCVDSLQDAHHHCGRCGAHLGTKKFLF